jgi:hypothetical protein
MSLSGPLIAAGVLLLGGAVLLVVFPSRRMKLEAL